MLRQRFGTFFLVIGLALIGLFILTDMGDKPQFGFFFLGVLSIVGGVVLWWRVPSSAPPPSSGRFRLIKSLSNRSKAKAKKK
jgi:hypothetical protein